MELLQDFLRRYCPQWADSFYFVAAGKPGEYKVSAGEGGGVLVRGGSPLAMAVGLRAYLEEYAGLHLAYCGQARVSLSLPKKQKKATPPQTPLAGRLPDEPRGFFTPLSYSCGPCWWDWPRWQEEIDILALQGVGAPLLLIGSETAWYNTLREEGLSADYALNTISAPPYWPRQLLGQFDGMLPVVDPLYLKARGQLGRQIAERMRAWGMAPVLPDFPGVVSQKTAGLFKGARLLPQPGWNGFPGVCKVDPGCAAYARLQENYRGQLRKVFGCGERLWDPQEERIEANCLPPCGHTVLHGDLHAPARADVLADDPESNPLLLACRMAQPEDLPVFLRAYAKNRYGTEEGAAALELLCQSVYAQTGPAPGSVFCMRPAMALEPTAPGDSLDCPCGSAPLFMAAKRLLGLRGGCDTPGLRYDVCDTLRQALSLEGRKRYLGAMEGFAQKDVRTFESGANDFLDALEDCDHLLRTVEPFRLSYHLQRARQCAKMDAERNNFELGLLLHHSIYGAGGVHKTLGYQLHGLCWREWGGLLGTLCLERWRAFFQLLAAHWGDRRFTLETKQKQLGRSAYAGNKYLLKMSELELNWLKSYAPPQEEKQEDVFEVAEELLKKYAAGDCLE